MSEKKLSIHESYKSEYAFLKGNGSLAAVGEWGPSTWHTDSLPANYRTYWRDRAISPLKKLSTNPHAVNFVKNTTSHLLQCIECAVDDLGDRTKRGELQSYQRGLIPVASEIRSELLQLKKSLVTDFKNF